MAAKNAALVARLDLQDINLAGRSLEDERQP